MCEIPVHCIIEALPEGHCIKCVLTGDNNKVDDHQRSSSETNRGGRLLIDSYAIVTGHTPLSKLNDVVLTAMGFSQFASHNASESIKTKGLILIDNWKPLRFDQITDQPNEPIEHLFKHIGGNRWALKIVVSGATTSNVDKASSVSPAGTNENALIISTTPTKTPEEREKVPSPEQLQPRSSSDPTSNINWYSLFPRYHPYLPSTYNHASAYVPRLDPIAAHHAAATASVQQSNLAAMIAANRLLLTNAEVTAAAALAGGHLQQQLSPQSSTGGWPDESSRSPPGDRTFSFSSSTTSRSPRYTPTIVAQQSPSLHPHHHQHLHQQRRSVLVAPRRISGSGSSTHSTPMPNRHAPAATCRLMFDPLTELPMLNEWFENNSHPTCHDIEKFTDTLNAKPYRRTYPPVSTHNVKIWFKNRRAKCKRL